MAKEELEHQSKLSADHLAAQKKVQEEMQGDQREGCGSAPEFPLPPGLTLSRKSTPVYRIVLTGGPCGGKSTAVATISDRLLSLGFRFGLRTHVKVPHPQVLPVLTCPDMTYDEYSSA